MQTHRNLVSVALVAMLVVTALAACSSSEPQGPTAEDKAKQAQAAAEQSRKAAEAEQRAKEEAARRAEEQRRQGIERAKLPQEFASKGAAAPAAAETKPAAEGAGAALVPYDQAFPPIPDRVLRVAVLSAPSQAALSRDVGVTLAETHREELERDLGMGIRVAFISQDDEPASEVTRVRYRNKFLQAAVRVASLLPSAQRVERMSDEEANRMGVDLLVLVGWDLR
jgi:hypothetical protein